MISKSRSLFRLSFSLFALVFLAAASFAQDFGKEQKEEVLDAINDLIQTKVFAGCCDLTRWPEIVESHQEELEAAEDKRTFGAIMNSALNDLGFSHLVLRVPRERRVGEGRRRGGNFGFRGRTVGIGVLIEEKEEGLLVTRVFPNAPASEAGIQAGDTILEVNGEKATTETIRFPRDETADVLIETSDGEQRTVKLKRREFSPFRTDSLEWIDDRTAVLKVASFGAPSYNNEQLEKFIEEAEKAEYLILDLRNNGGGAVSNLRHMSGLFLPSGTPIGTFISKKDVEKYVEDTERDPNDLPAVARWTTDKLTASKVGVPYFKGRVAVLINSRSASASEMVAAALHEHLSAPIVGTPSAGKVLMSVFGQLPQGFSIQYPISDYVTLRGIRLEGAGLTPDAEVESTVLGSDSPDPAVEKAIELLRKRAGVRAADRAS